MPLEDIVSPKTNLKKYLTFDQFMQSVESLKIGNWGMLWINLCAIWRFYP